MSKTFTITYTSGLTEDVQMELETAEEVANQVFGRTLAEAVEMGCNVALVGDYVPPDPVMTGTITAFSDTSPTVVETAEDILVSGNMVTLNATAGSDAGQAEIDGMTVEVLSVSPFTQLDLDLSATDVTGLQATYDIQPPPAPAPAPAEPPAEPPAPAPAPAPAEPPAEPPATP